MLLSSAPVAGAASFDVTTSADSGAGSLRQAITDANGNANPGTTDAIRFDTPLTGGDTITILDASAELPAITQPVTINGCDDPNDASKANNAGPCVGLRAETANSSNGLVAGTSGVTVRGLAVTNANVGVSIGSSGPTGLTVRNCWFGIKLDGSAEGDFWGVGLFGDSSTVGGTAGATGSAPADRNVFANNTLGVALHQGDGNQILGNYFGTNPNGTGADFMGMPVSGNRENIEVVGGAGGSDPAEDNTIGGTVSGAALTSTACDGACNLISRTIGTGVESHHGIDLQGDQAVEPDEMPAQGATIAGNFIGLDVNGTTDLGNNRAGVNVGGADDVTVGGPGAGDRNFIGGNDVWGIFSGSGASSLSIQNNFIGLGSPAGAAAIPDDSDGVELEGPGTVADNRFGGIPSGPSSGPDDEALRLEGSGATVTGNLFGLGGDGLVRPLPDTAIRITADGNTVGGLDPGTPTVCDGPCNVIGAAGGTSAGIIVNASSNQILGNFIGTDSAGNDLGNGGAGIAIFSNDVDGNAIGGDTAASENLISNNGGAAVSVAQAMGGVSNDANLIARNRGSGNAGLFIDLTPPLGAGNDAATGPNDGAQAPVITAPLVSSVGGTAPAGAIVRVFIKASAASSELDGYLGQATASASGGWTLTYPSPLSPGMRIAATQTEGGSTSELATAVTVAVPPCAGAEATMVGSDGSDELNGTPDRDVIAALGGDDVARGLGAGDRVCGGAGRDRLIGGPGPDRLLGQAGRDRLRGGAGRDLLKGGRGRDVLKGGRGRDVLRGGPGRDTQAQ